MGLFDSFGRGAAQGATAGFSDEAVAKLLASLPGPSTEADDGIPREYAAGSPEQDYLQTERADNQRAAAEHPVAYGAGELTGGLPATLAVPAGAGGSAAARVAAGGLTGGALGGLSGAGHADGRSVATEAGRGALLGGLAGTGGAAAIESAPFVKQAMSQVGPELTAAPAGATINESRAAMLPPRPNTGDMPAEAFVPKAAKPLNASKLNGPKGRSTDAAAERATVPSPEPIDAKAPYRAAEHRNRQTPAARGPQFSGDDVTETLPVPPPKKLNYKNAPKQARSADRKTAPAPYADAESVPAPAPTFNSSRPTQPAPYADTPTIPPPPMPLEYRPTMPDMGPVRPTLKPGSEQAYKDAVLQEIADSARRASL